MVLFSWMTKLAFEWSGKWTKFLEKLGEKTGTKMGSLQGSTQQKFDRRWFQKCHNTARWEHTCCLCSLCHGHQPKINSEANGWGKIAMDTNFKVKIGQRCFFIRVGARESGSGEISFCDEPPGHIWLSSSPMIRATPQVAWQQTHHS